MEISYLLLAAIFDRNEQFNLPMNNIIPSLQTINADIHVPRIDSLKRYLLKLTELYDISTSPSEVKRKVSMLYAKHNEHFDFSNQLILSLYILQCQNITL